MKIYIAGPMTGYENHNYPAFDAVSDYLQSLGHSVVSPCDLNRMHGYNPNLDGTITEEDYARLFRHDVLAILNVDAIALLPGWEASKGAKVEAIIGSMIGLKFLDHKGNRIPVPKFDTFVAATV